MLSGTHNAPLQRPQQGRLAARPGPHRLPAPPLISAGRSHPASKPSTVCRSNQPDEAPAPPAAPAAAPAGPALSVLQNTTPIDRTRSQARLIFDQFDTDSDGLLSQEQLLNFFQYCASKCGHSPATAQLLEGQKQSALAQLAAEQPVNLEQFVQLFRQQLDLIRESSYVDTLFVGQRRNEVVLKSNLSKPELSQVHWRFALLDFDGDGQLKLEELQRVPGIEAQIAADQLDDLDEDEDGLVGFDQFLTTYAKPRKVWLTILVMAVNTLLIWGIFNSPLDMMLKSVAAVVLVVKPQIVNRPIIKVYEIVETILNRGKAEVALRAA